jgi:two-component system response regulator DevR
MAPEPRKPDAGSEPPESVSPTARVLIVEDHPLLAEALRQLFDSADDLAVVGLATSQFDAVRLASELRPDVVVMDSHIREGSGAEAAARIRAVKPDTVIVFLSADDRDAEVFAAVEAGASAYLSKVSDPEVVLDTLRRAISGEMLIPAAILARLISSKRASDLSEAERAKAAARFTERERQVLELMGEALDNVTIGSRLFIEVSTVRWHIKSILEKLGAHSKLEAVMLAAQLGILER